MKRQREEQPTLNEDAYKEIIQQCVPGFVAKRMSQWRSLQRMRLVCRAFDQLILQWIVPNLKEIPRAVNKNLEKFRQLSTLIIDRNNMRIVTKSFLKRLSFLRNLSFRQDHGFTINIDDEEIFHRLTTLNVSNMLAIPSNLMQHLTNLTKLNLGSCIGVTDESIINLAPTLIHLNIAYNPFISDTGLSQLTNLEELNLNDNKMITNAGIATLTKLKKLDISETLTISSLPRSLIDLSINEYSSIGNDELRMLTNLKILSLYNNDMYADETFRQLTNIETLVIDGTEYGDQALMPLIKLRNLQLGSNTGITNACLSQMTQLTILSLDANEHIIDDALQQLKCLTTLDLSYNDFITNESISKLTQLTSLNLSYVNNITDDALRGLSRLQFLSLYMNGKISCNVLSYLSSLRTLELNHSSRVKKDDVNSYAVELIYPPLF